MAYDPKLTIDGGEIASIHSQPMRFLGLLILPSQQPHVGPMWVGGGLEVGPMWVGGGLEVGPTWDAKLGPTWVPAGDAG